MTYKNQKQKLVSFKNDPQGLQEISNEMKSGWSIISLVRDGNNFVGIMEMIDKTNFPDGTVFIPARKKLKFTA